MKTCVIALAAVLACLTNDLRADSPMAGDFTQDGQLTELDVDLLTRVIHTQNAWFDLDHDGVLSINDRKVWIEDLAGTYVGDANLDGSFDTSDFVTIFQAAEYDDGIVGNSTWAEGDFNGDGDFDAADFVYVFVQYGYEIGPRPDGPGPATWIWEHPGTAPPPTPGTSAWLADLDLDQYITVADIDLLSLAVREQSDGRAWVLFDELGFDVNGDGQITADDREWWVERLKGTYMGDADLDGRVGSGDLVLAFQGGKYALDEWASWRDGDWNGDFRFDSYDFVLFIANLPEPGPHAAVAPEPAANLPLILVGAVTITMLRPIRNRSRQTVA